MRTARQTIPVTKYSVAVTTQEASKCAQTKYGFLIEVVVRAPVIGGHCIAHLVGAIIVFIAAVATIAMQANSSNEFEEGQKNQWSC